LCADRLRGRESSYREWRGKQRENGTVCVGSWVILHGLARGAGKVAEVDGDGGRFRGRCEVAVDGMVGVEELVGDVGEDGGAAGGDAAFSDEDEEAAGEASFYVEGGIEFGGYLLEREKSIDPTVHPAKSSGMRRKCPGTPHRDANDAHETEPQGWGTQRHSSGVRRGHARLIAQRASGRCFVVPGQQWR